MSEMLWMPGSIIGVCTPGAICPSVHWSVVYAAPSMDASTVVTPACAQVGFCDDWFGGKRQVRYA